jgi:hypothetical protein
VTSHTWVCIITSLMFELSVMQLIPRTSAVLPSNLATLYIGPSFSASLSA